MHSSVPIKDYLHLRLLNFKTINENQRLNTTSGAIHSSILSPVIWKVAYDCPLMVRPEVPKETVLVGYTDYVSVHIAARNVKLAQL